MAIITFYTDCKEEAGNTIAALSYATCMGIIENKKTLLISTGLNETTLTDALWKKARKNMLAGLLGPSKTRVSQAGMAELQRMAKSNKLTSELITNYSRVALKGRLEVLTEFICNAKEPKEVHKQYVEIQNEYARLVTLAKDAYDNIIVDLSRLVENKIKKDILNASDIIIALTTQKAQNIETLAKKIKEGKDFPANKTIIAIGKYDNKSKYNAKNLTRTYLKQKDAINTIPYNTLVFESIQEGELIDLFLRELGLKTKDDNTFFLDELKRLRDTITYKLQEIQMKK